MKSAIVAVTTLLVSATAFAAEVPQQGQGRNFENFKTNVINRINARIARNQEELSCVQAAQDHNALKACRQKFASEMKAERQQMKGQQRGPRPQN